MKRLSSKGISPLKVALMKGAAWTIGLRWSNRLLGLISTAIVARIVTPADYGIVAMAFLVWGLVRAMINFGPVVALMRKKDVSNDEINSAWSLGVIQELAVGVLLIVVAPLAAEYFKSPKVALVVWVIAACVIVSSVKNIGPVLAQKEFNYSIDFKIQVTSKIVSVIVTVLSAFVFRDYRALLSGFVAAWLVSLFMSYAIHPYRPKWNTKHISEIWNITKWLMFSGIANYILTQGDEVAAGRIGSIGAFGQYNVSADIGQLPVGELGPALLRALMPVLAKLQKDIEWANKVVLKTISALNTVIIPIGVGFSAIALPATNLILGLQWREAASFVSLFALISIMNSAVSPLQTLLITFGHTKSQMLTAWAEFCVFVIVSFLLVPHMSLLGLIYGRFFGRLMYIFLMVALSQYHNGIRPSSVVLAVWRPLAGSVMMYLLVKYVLFSVSDPLMQLCIGILVGVIFYTTWTFITWNLVGRPEGFESTLIDLLYR